MLPAKEAIIDGEITALDDKGNLLLSSSSPTEAIRTFRLLLRLRSDQLGRNRPARPTTYRVPQAARETAGKSSGQYLIFRTTARFGRRVPPGCASIPARALDRQK